MFILGSQVSAIGSQVQVISTRYGYGIFLHLHPNLNTRTRCLTAETRDLKIKQRMAESMTERDRVRARPPNGGRMAGARLRRALRA